jgi:hypothetical protein
VLVEAEAAVAVEAEALAVLVEAAVAGLVEAVRAVKEPMELLILEAAVAVLGAMAQVHLVVQV